MRAWIIAAALACAAAPAGAEAFHAAAYFVPMFDPASDASDGPAPVTLQQNGQNVEAAQGAKLILQLPVNPSTGAHWEVTQKPDFLGEAEIEIAPAPLGPGQRPRLGAPQMATIAFDVTGRGSADLALEMHGPAPGSPALQSFRVTVTAE
jgi:predicted secreted protein